MRDKMLTVAALDAALAKLHDDMHAAQREHAAATQRDALAALAGGNKKARADDGALLVARVDHLVGVVAELERLRPVAERGDLLAEIEAQGREAAQMQAQIDKLGADYRTATAAVQAVPFGERNPAPFRGQTFAPHPAVAEKNRLLSDIRSIEGDLGHLQLRTQALRERVAEIERTQPGFADLAEQIRSAGFNV